MIKIKMKYDLTTTKIHRSRCQRSVKVLFDENFEGKKVIIHPLRNTASVSITFDDLKRFVEHYGHTYRTEGSKETRILERIFSAAHKCKNHSYLYNGIKFLCSSGYTQFQHTFDFWFLSWSNTANL